MSWHDEPALLRRLELLRGAEVRVAGRTVQGREIPAVRVGPGGPGRPQVMLTANIHGTEAIGSEVALAVLELLTAAEPPPVVRDLLAVADVHVLPAVNLDARAAAVEALARGAWWARAPRGNAHGVDLNRNFPFVAGSVDAWHPLAGSRFPWLPWYRGPEPLSEPEARAVADLAASLRPVAAVGLHSVGRLFLYPWCARPEPPAAQAAFEAMGRAFVEAQPGPKYTVKQARAWYAILGDMDDWLYDAFGTVAVTVELGRVLEGLRTHPWRLGSAAAWMNPAVPAEIISWTALPCLHALLEGVRQAGGGRP
ncbi:MAG: M14 family metallopeptidase [Pseudomonadota bacterium]